MGDGATTVGSFPTYAALTETQGWQTAAAAPVELEDTLQLEIAANRYYQFVDNHILIAPQMHDLPRTGSIVVLLAASVASLIVPSVFVARLRQALTEAQLRLHLQAWHFKRLGTS